MIDVSADAPLSLTVAEARREDVGRGVVRLDPEALATLGAAPGDILLLEGKTRTTAKAMPTYKSHRGQQIIQLDGVVRINAGAKLHSKIAVSAAPRREAVRVAMAPLEPGRISEEELDFIARRLDGLPVLRGDLVRAALFSAGHRDFRVTRTEPEGPVIVHPDTLLVIDKEIGREKRAENAKNDVEGVVTYDDLGGMERELEKVREMIELPLTHPEVFDRLGIRPPKGVLLHGAPGCGKTLLARAIAHEADAAFIYVSGPEIIQKFYGESEARLRKIFDDAKTRAPCIVFFDEIDAIAPKREKVEGEVEKRVVAQLLALLDGLESRGEVIVMAATNRPDSLDPALRRPGRFDREITISAPSRRGRREILEIHSRGMPLAADVDLDRLAEAAHGFTGADLAALCREAAMAALRRNLPILSPDKGPVPYDALLAMEVTMEDCSAALSEVEPSGLREFTIDVPNVGWEEVGGLDTVKSALLEAISWPLSQPDLFEKIGLQAPRGILLYGPPGNGKTLVVKALATQGNLNFISVKGPELLSKYVGESERAVRDLFVRARQSAPCLVFLDEVDALAPSRGSDDRSAVTDRVTSQLLTELDGVEARKDVWVIAATNRSDMLDEALLRPGRLDYHIEVPRPDAAARNAILDVHLRRRPIDPAVDIEDLARRTEGMSAAELRFFCDRATMNALRRIFPSTAGAGRASVADIRLRQEDFEQALAHPVRRASNGATP